MKSKIGYSVILAIIMGISISNASADHSKVDVNIIEGSAVPGCEEKNECYIPYNIIVDAGGEVIWNNNDNAAHTITSGTPNDGPDGLFDSSLFTAGSTFSVIFDDSFKTGNYHYFCMVHPWMEGIVSVEEVAEEKMITENIDTTETIQTQENNKTIIQNISADGTITIEIETSKPTINEGMSIDIRFSDYNNKQ